MAIVHRRSKRRRRLGPKWDYPPQITKAAWTEQTSVSFMDSLGERSPNVVYEAEIKQFNDKIDRAVEDYKQLYLR
jgi:hypothetical protein